MRSLQLSLRWSLLTVCAVTLLLAVALRTSAASVDSTNLDNQLAQLQSDGAEQLLDLVTRQASLLPRDAKVQFMLGMTLLEAGHADAASAALHRAWQASPELFKRPQDLREIFGTRFDTVSARLAEQAKQGNRDALFLLGLLYTWGGDRSGGDSALRLYELLSGGDPLATSLLGETQVRADMRAEAAAKRGSLDEALAELLLASAQAELRWSREGKLSALLISTGKIKAARERLSMHLDSQEAMGSLIAALPPSNSHWWSYAGLRQVLDSIDQDEISALRIVALSASGEWLVAESIVRDLLADPAKSAASGLNARQVNQLDLFVGACRGAGLPPDAAAAKAKVLATDAEILALLKAGEQDDAAQEIVKRKSKEDESASVLALTTAWQIHRGDWDQASGALLTWLRMLKAGDSLTPLISPAFSSEGWKETKRKLGAALQANPTNVELRIILAVMLVQDGDAEALKHARMLDQMYAGEAGFENLLALAEQLGSSEHMPEPNTADAPDAGELKRMGDAAMRAGKFQSALDNYLAAGKLDATLSGLAAGLFRARFGLGEFERAAKDLLELLKDAKVSDSKSARSFSTGLEDAYSDRKQLKEDAEDLVAHCEANPLNTEEWLLLGVVLYELSDARASKTLNTAASIATPNSSLRTYAQAFATLSD